MTPAPHTWTVQRPEPLESARSSCACGVWCRTRYTMEEGYVTEWSADGVTWQRARIACGLNTAPSRTVKAT